MAEITPNHAKTLVENNSIIIYRDTSGAHWRVMKTFGNTRFPITVVDVPEAPGQEKMKINAEELI